MKTTISVIKAGLYHSIPFVMLSIKRSPEFKKYEDSLNEAIENYPESTSPIIKEMKDYCCNELNRLPDNPTPEELSEVQEKFVQYLSLVDLKIESSADSGF